MMNECHECNNSYLESEGEMITLFKSEDDGPEVWMCHNCIGE